MDLTERLASLHTALLCDALDGLGFRDSAFGPMIRPLVAGSKVAGRAFTMRAVAVDEARAEPYQDLFAAYGSLEPGHVIVIAAGDQVSAMWGELLSVAARARGAVGVVIDGLVRDVAQIAEVGFPMFAAGTSPLDSAGRQEIVEYGSAIDCGMATVSPGDWIFGDEMGVIVIPAQLAEEAVRLAEEKDAGESIVRSELERGDDIGEVFARHGVL